jgi:hypothetical protein
MDVTILEIDLGDAEFNAPFAAGGGDGQNDNGQNNNGENDDEESGAADSSGVDPRPVVAVAVLLVFALLARYLRSGDENADIEADELEIEES